jgi:hypothetical protein
MPRGRRLALALAILLASNLGSILLPSTVTSAPVSCLQPVGANCPPLNHHEALRLLIRAAGLLLGAAVLLWPRVRRSFVGFLSLAGLTLAVGRRRVGHFFVRRARS